MSTPAPRFTDGPKTRQARLAEAARRGAAAHAEWGEDLTIVVVVGRRGGDDVKQDGSDGLVVWQFEGADDAAALLTSAARALYASAGVPTCAVVRPVGRG